MCRMRMGLLLLILAAGMATLAHGANQIVNWEFNEPLAANNWWLWETANFERVEPVPDNRMSGEMSLRVVIPDGAAGSLQIIQSYLELVQGQTYYISFMARADEPRTIAVKLQARTEHDWTVYWQVLNIQLTPETQTYEFEYTHTGPTVGGTGQFNSDIDFYFTVNQSDIDLNIDRVWLDTEPAPDITVPVLARQPDPPHTQTDVPIDAMLGWTPGTYAATHDVYLGTAFTDVNNATRGSPLGVLVSQGQTATTCDPPGDLAFDTTHYWRIDEVNAPPDSTIFKGDIWNFTTEPFVYPISNITATASSSDGNAGPENTINGSGLNASDQHSINASDMWLTATGAGQPPWIQYEFDQLYKLHEMWVWNYNVQFELVLGFGLKDVTVEYSADGVDWTSLGQVEFGRGTARNDYVANTTIDMAGAVARYVRLTADSGYGMLGQFGLSEVRFFHKPVAARDPMPADGQTGVDLDVVLDWRGGRDAVSHDVYFDADSQAVQDGTALIDTVDESRYAVSGLDLGTVYYWKVDEVNEADTPSAWEGPLWSFSTTEYLTVDDFESYTDDIDAGETIFQTWIDGWTNDNGSTVGYFDAPFAELSIVHGGSQSMPLEYNNAEAPYYSEAERDLGGQDWTAGGANTLVVWFRGNAAATATDPGNDPATLYAAVEDSAGHVAVVAHPDPDATGALQWQEWPILFSDLAGVDLSSVAKLYIGLGDRNNPTTGGTGLIFIDDILIGHPLIP